MNFSYLFNKPKELYPTWWYCPQIQTTEVKPAPSGTCTVVTAYHCSSFLCLAQAIGVLLICTSTCFRTKPYIWNVILIYSHTGIMEPVSIFALLFSVTHQHCVTNVCNYKNYPDTSNMKSTL